MKKNHRFLIPVLTLGLASCQGGSSPADTLARAGGVEFTPEAAAEILAPQTELPNQPEVVEALANLWVDYFLLARAAAEDSTLANLDVGTLVEQSVNQELVLRLRDQVIQVDTAVSQEELLQLYERELPGTRVRARHILLRFPEGASTSQADSVRALAGSLRERIESGEDFGDLARQFSEDTGSGANGGDLGSFGKGEMVPPFEEAAFALAQGEVSPVVETTFGLHIIRVDERIVPPVEENLEQFRTLIQNRRVAEAESTFVAGIIEGAQIEVSQDGFQVARQLAENPDLPISSRAQGRSLVSFTGGDYTVGDFREWLLFRPGALRNEVQAATDEQLGDLFTNLTRERLLIQRAGQEGIEVSAARVDSLASVIREGVREVAEQLGFLALAPEEGESLDDAAYAAVVEILAEIVQNGREVIPLGGVSLALKQQFDAVIYKTGLDQTVAQIAELRTQLPPSPPPLGGPPQTDELAVPDSGGTSG